MLDITQSFEVNSFRRTIFALQNIFGALKTGSDDMKVALVLYPYVFSGKGYSYRPSSINISFSDSCMTSIKNLEKLAESVFYSKYQSEDTRSYEALEFISDGIIGTKPTAVVTVTDGPSESTNLVPNPLGRIAAAISKIRTTRPSTRFFAAGVELDEENRVSSPESFEAELLALGEGIKSHHILVQNGIVAFIDGFLDLLVKGNVLCPNQSKEIDQAVGTLN